jgi:hypothetical protein
MADYASLIRPAVGERTAGAPDIAALIRARLLRSPPCMAEALGIDDGLDTLGKSNAFGMSFEASAMPAAEKGDAATRLSHVWKPRSVSEFQRTDPLTGVAVNDIDKALSGAPINFGDLDVHRVGPHRPGMMAIER